MNTAMFTRIKNEAAKGHKVWILGVSGVGKSYTLAKVGGFDLDWIGTHTDKGWTLDTAKGLPGPEVKIVGGSFDSPSFEEFIGLWKPDIIYVITCDPDTYGRTWLRKAAERNCTKFFLDAAGIHDSVVHDWKKSHNATDSDLEPAKLMKIMSRPMEKLAALRRPFIHAINRHKEDDSGAWHDESGKIHQVPLDLIGLACLALEGKGSKARTLLRARLIDPKYNPGSWSVWVRKFQRNKVRIPQSILKLFEERNKRNPFRSKPTQVAKAHNVKVSR